MSGAQITARIEGRVREILAGRDAAHV